MNKLKLLNWSTLMTLLLVLVVFIACEKQITPDNIVVDQNQITISEEVEVNKPLNFEFPEFITQEDIKNNELKLAELSAQKKTGPACNPAVSFSASASGLNYACTGTKDACSLSWQGFPCTNGIWVDADRYYSYALYSSTSSNGTYYLEYVINDYTVGLSTTNFTISNPPDPGKFYLIDCVWINYVMCSGTYEIDFNGPFQVFSNDIYLEHNDPPPPPFSASITGPVWGNNTGIYTWSVTNVVNGPATSYLWKRSSDGGQTYPYTMSTSSSFTAQMPQDQDLYLKCTINGPNGQQVIDYWETYNNAH